MDKELMRDLETMNVGSNTHLLGYDPGTGKTAFVPAYQVSGKVPWFGRKWAKGNSSPVGSPIGDIDLGQELGRQLGLGGYLVQNNHSRQKLSPTNHNFLESGAAADLTGGAGHYHWGWNAPFFYQNYEDDTYFYETVSLAGPRPGFWNYRIPVGSRSCAGYATMDRTNSKLVSYVNSNAQYRGGNNDSTLDGAFNSQLCKPVSSMDIGALRTAARRNGDLWFANERVMHFVTAMLKRIIFGTRDVQAAFNATLDANGLRQGGTGLGADLPNDWGGNFGYHPYLRLDVGISEGDKTGLISTTITENGAQKTIGNIPSFFGLKNDYKYLWCMSENMLLQNNADKSQSLYIDDDIDGSLMNYDSVAGLNLVAKGPAAESGQWMFIQEYSLKNLAFFPKAGTGGSTSTFFCDGYYNPAETSGLRGAGLLGVAGDGGDAGSLCLNGCYGVWAAGAYWGAFLCEWAEAFTTQPTWYAAN